MFSIDTMRRKILRLMNEAMMRWLKTALAVAFLLCVLLNVVNVFGRYVIGRTLSWADTAQVFILVWMTFLGMALTAWERRHLRMDLLVQGLRPRFRSALRAVEACLVLVVCGFAAWHSGNYAWRTFQMRQSSESEGLPMWLAHSAVGLGLALVVVITLMQWFQRGRDSQ